MRVPGRAVFMTSNPDYVPAALLRNLEHNKVLHEEAVILTVVSEETPRAARRLRHRFVTPRWRGGRTLEAGRRASMNCARWRRA